MNYEIEYKYKGIAYSGVYSCPEHELKSITKETNLQILGDKANEFVKQDMKAKKIELEEGVYPTDIKLYRHSKKTAILLWDANGFSERGQN